MVFTSIMCSLFIIGIFAVSYQRTLKKPSLKLKTVSQLCQMKHEEFIKYKQAKEMKLYGVMGLSAQLMCEIEKELKQKSLPYHKQRNIILGSTIMFHTLLKSLR